ncbi:hypothetical protein [Microbispora amethystogenes]|uniref:Uncharacterized protein n=1 Tax=Microbispora amethystogenes TaxID=1427754 RepID=A0ABQ4FI64_9ACTN|nr:hypothetical protein [Microbispora amethystogenes]GIH34464.1 hypothetical protein Mam01_46280 [Microbispora amethystogenes]
MKQLLLRIGDHPHRRITQELADIRQIYPPEREALGVVAFGIELIETARSGRSTPSGPAR